MEIASFAKKREENGDSVRSDPDVEDNTGAAENNQRRMIGWGDRASSAHSNLRATRVADT